MTVVTPGIDESPHSSIRLLALAEKLEGAQCLVSADDRAIAAATCRLAAKPADEGVREEAAYAAYLGICVLATMCKKAGLFLAEKRATELLIEMGRAFPEFAGRSALRATTGAPKP